MNRHSKMMAELEIKNKKMSVWEMESEFSYNGPDGKSLVSIRKTPGKAGALSKVAQAEYSADDYKKILKSKADILGKKVLAGKEDPSYEKVAELLPPLGNPYTFLGEREYHHRPLPRIEWDGSISGCLGFGLGSFQPWRDHFVCHEQPGKNENTAKEADIKHSLLDGYLPAIQFVCQNENDKIGWEEIAFAKSYEKCDNSMLVFIRIKLKNFKNSSRREKFSILFTPFIHAHTNYPIIQQQTRFSVQSFYPAYDGNSVGKEPEWLWVSEENDWQKGKVYPQGILNLDCSFKEGEEKTFYLIFAYPHYLRRGTFEKIVPDINFYRALFEMKKDWDKFLDKGLKVETPEARVNNACKATLIQSFLTVVNSDVKYAAAGGYSERPDLDGLPISIINAAECFSEWGYEEETKRYLAYFLKHYITENGVSKYGGGAGLYDYGLLLYAISRCYHLCGKDNAWLKENITPIRNICRLITEQRKKSLKSNSPDSHFYGLISSTLGDDLKNLGAAWYNYSNDACCWFGLRETAKMFMESGGKDILQEGRRLLKFSEAYKKDIITSLKKSINYSSKPVFIPMYPGNRKPFSNFATMDNLTTYCNYGFYPHLLYANLFDPGIASAIVKFREKRGGEILGSSRLFLKRLDNWPLAEFGWTLINLDEVKKFLLTYYGDMAHLRMRDVFTAYEQVEISPLKDGYRFITNGHNICSNLVTPRMTKYMLVFEERDKDLLWLNRAIPRKWLEDGKKIIVQDAPTRFGKISYSVESHISENYITADISVDSVKEFSMKLRFRHPEKKKISRATINGEECSAIDLKNEGINISTISKIIKVKVIY